MYSCESVRCLRLASDVHVSETRRRRFEAEFRRDVSGTRRRGRSRVPDTSRNFGLELVKVYLRGAASPTSREIWVQRFGAYRISQRASNKLGYTIIRRRRR